MKLYNIKNTMEVVTFFNALVQGLGTRNGLFFPVNLPKFSINKVHKFFKMNFIDRSVHILYEYIGSELSKDNILDCVKDAFSFPVPLVLLKENIAFLELFHGPTLSFKDFGCQLMAKILYKFKQKYEKKPMVILTATSGDTGAAVAHAFYGLDNIHVIILYPKGKISTLQEKLFCTLGGNISTISINGDFDYCQSLVKKAFDDILLKQRLCLNSANSINISRLLAQICYYFEAISQVSNNIMDNNNIVISVPSGNFGNLTAGLLAQSSGLPVKSFIAATNINNTVPRFLENGFWSPLPTVSSFSNAMDVSRPSNWSRIEELFRRENKSIKELRYGCVNDELTKKTIQDIANLGYIIDPHTAVAYRLLEDQLDVNEFGICLSTAHPAKFKELIEYCLVNKLNILLPDVLKKYKKLPTLSYTFSGSFYELRDLILKIIL